MTGFELIWTLYFTYTVWFFWKVTYDYYDTIVDIVECVFDWKDEADEMETFYQTTIFWLEQEIAEKEELIESLTKLP